MDLPTGPARNDLDRVARETRIGASWKEPFGPDRSSAETGLVREVWKPWANLHQPFWFLECGNVSKPWLI